MATIFKPHRGKASIMANQKKNIILEAGEMFIELPDDNSINKHCKMKIGDGVSTYENLEYVMGDAPTNIDTVLDKVYPIGSIYMSVNNTSPATLFGGTWEQLKDRFLLGAGSSYTAGGTGGSTNITPSGSLSNGAVQSHTLTVNEIPSHSHAGIQAFKAAWAPGQGGYYVWGSNQNRNEMSTTSSGGGQGHTHGFTQPTFTGVKHTNMPPYLVVYMWKRTA